MRGKEIHIRIDPSVYQLAKQAMKRGKLRGSLGQIAERGIVSELEKIAGVAEKLQTDQNQITAKETDLSPGQSVKQQALVTLERE